MFKEPGRLLLDKLRYHVAQNCPDGIEALIGGADIVQPVVIKQNFLHNENGHRLAKFRPSLHNSEAEGNDLGSEKEVDNLGRIVLDQGANDAKGSKTEVLEGSRLGCRVQKGVQEKRDMRCGTLSDASSQAAHM